MSVSPEQLIAALNRVRLLSDQLLATRPDTIPDSTPEQQQLIAAAYRVCGHAISAAFQSGLPPQAALAAGRLRELINHRTNGTPILDDDELELGSPEYHEGVVFSIRHPGPTQMGCTYCIETLRQGLTR